MAFVFLSADLPKGRRQIQLMPFCGSAADSKISKASEGENYFVESFKKRKGT